MHPRGGHIALVSSMALALASTGCANESALAASPPVSSPPPTSRDAGAGPSSDAAVPTPSEAIFREDFEHLGYVESSSAAVVDINHSWVTLPTEPFPQLVGEGVRTLSEHFAYNGLVDAGSIIVVDDVTVDATDSIELRANGTVHISGRVRAGAGGVRIAAGRAIYIDGVIESAGPVLLQLAGADGTIGISGRIVTLASASRASGGIAIEGRGGVHISGTLETGAATYGDSGDITVRAYGDVLATETARLACGASIGGDAGSVRIATEGRVEIAGAYLLGGNGEAASGTRISRAGDVSIRGADIALIDAANLAGGGSANGPGGGVTLVPARTLRATRAAQIVGGAGTTGGSLTFHTTTASLAAHLRAGPGDEEAGRVVVTTAGPLYLESEAQLVGGDGGCAAGGEVLLLVGGSLFFQPTGVELIGGRGGTSVGSTCFGDYAGGSVNVFAQYAAAAVESVAQGGVGSPNGKVNVTLDARFSRVSPDVRPLSRGWVISQPIPRTPRQFGGAPELLALDASTPPGTRVRIEMADASEDPQAATWHPLIVGDPRSGEALREATSVRYRVFLTGRAFDAPVVDSFDIALGGR